VIGRNPFLKVELVEQPILRPDPLAHHRKNPIPITSGQRNHDPIPASTEFFNSLG
jgi:hypothetical protein